MVKAISTHVERLGAALSAAALFPIFLIAVRIFPFISLL
jgi:hypothetical protein